MTSLAFSLQRHKYLAPAPKGEVMAGPAFAAAFGHPLGPHQWLTSTFGPYHRAMHSFSPSFWRLLVDSLAFCLVRHQYAAPAPKGRVMARTTLAAAIGHPLGPHHWLTSRFGPYHRAMYSFSFVLAFVSDFSSFWPCEAQIRCASAQRQSNGPTNICRGLWASIGSTTKADFNVWSIPSRHVLMFLRSGFC